MDIDLIANDITCFLDVLSKEGYVVENGRD